MVHETRLENDSQVKNLQAQLSELQQQVQKISIANTATHASEVEVVRLKLEQEHWKTLTAGHKQELKDLRLQLAARDSELAQTTKCAKAAVRAAGKDFLEFIKSRYYTLEWSSMHTRL